MKVINFITAGLLCACLTFSGCETTANTSSTVKGTGAGAAVGAGVGKIARNTAVEAVFGTDMDEQRAAEQRAAEQRDADKRAAEQKAAEQRVAEQRAAAERKSAEQKLSTLIKDCYEVKEHSDYSGWRITFSHEKIAGNSSSLIRQFVNLLNKDFWSCYSDLSETYNTELKKKAFSNTDEYISLNNELTSFSDMAKRNIYYFYYTFYDYDSYRIEPYDLATKSFLCKNLYQEAPYICDKYYSDIRLSYPSEYTIQTKNYGKKVSIPVSDENIALEIENNMKDCAVLFIFNIEKIEKNETYNRFHSDESKGAGPYYILGKTKSVHIVNTKSGKVYVQVQVPL
jgi:hypothetical protein